MPKAYRKENNMTIKEELKKEEIKKHYGNYYAEWITSIEKIIDVETSKCTDSEMLNELEYRIDEYNNYEEKFMIEDEKELNLFKQWVKVFKG